MTSYRSLRIGVVAMLVLVLLAVAGLPAYGQQVHPQAVQVAGFGDQLWNVLVDLWLRAWQKEGVTIDPDGKNGQAVNPNPAQVTPDEGVTIDPDGK